MSNKREACNQRALRRRRSFVVVVVGYGEEDIKVSWRKIWGKHTRRLHNTSVPWYLGCVENINQSFPAARMANTVEILFSARTRTLLKSASINQSTGMNERTNHVTIITYSNAIKYATNKQPNKQTKTDTERKSQKEKKKSNQETEEMAINQSINERQAQPSH